MIKKIVNITFDILGLVGAIFVLMNMFFILFVSDELVSVELFLRLSLICVLIYLVKHIICNVTDIFK